jgi:hypothetical protein
MDFFAIQPPWAAVDGRDVTPFLITEISNLDPHPESHENNKLERDPHQFADDKPK